MALSPVSHARGLLFAIATECTAAVCDRSSAVVSICGAEEEVLYGFERGQVDLLCENVELETLESKGRNGTQCGYREHELDNGRRPDT